MSAPGWENHAAQTLEDSCVSSALSRESALHICYSPWEEPHALGSSLSYIFCQIVFQRTFLKKKKQKKKL